MKTVKIDFKGFCVILTECKYFDKGVNNVSFSKFEKDCIKKKLAYTTDVEKEENSISRKIVFPLINAKILSELIYDRYLEFEADTMGSLTIEYGWLPAKSYGNYNDYSKQETNAYISPLFSIDGPDQSELTELQKSKIDNWIDSTIDSIFGLIDNDQFEELIDSKFSFEIDLSQLELNFNS